MSAPAEPAAVELVPGGPQEPAFGNYFVSAYPPFDLWRGDSLARAHALSDCERLVREFALQLKLLSVRLGPLRESFGVDPLEVFAQPLRLCADAGWLTCTEDELALTPEGVPRVDRMLAEFYLPDHR